MESKDCSGSGISALIFHLECRCHNGFGPPADLDHPLQIWTPLNRFGPPLPNFSFKHRVYPDGVRTPIALHCGSFIFNMAVKAAEFGRF